MITPHVVKETPLRALLWALATTADEVACSEPPCARCSTPERRTYATICADGMAWRCGGHLAQHDPYAYARWRARPAIERCEGGTIYLARRLVMESPRALDRLAEVLEVAA